MWQHASAMMLQHPIETDTLPDGRDPHRELIVLLVRLRYGAVLGLGLLLTWLAHHLHLRLAYPAIAVVAGLMVLASLAAQWRLRSPAPVSPLEAMAQLVLDLLLLTAFLYLAGGPANPFVSLYLVPVALASITLGRRQVFELAALAAVSYTLLLFHHRPLPHHHGGGDFDLHVLGMWVNFLISATVLAVFLSRLAAQAREQRQRLARERERVLRDEALLGMGTLAAGTAHEINTPLATMSLLVDDWRQSGAVPDPEDLETVQAQLERIRGHVRTLAELTHDGHSGGQRVETVAALLARTLSRWSLLRPGIVVDWSPDAVAEATRLRSDASLPMALANLVNNAADASLRAGSDRIRLAVEADTAGVRILIMDGGAGPAPATGSDGLGLGLMISNASIERLGGEVRQYPGETGGHLTEVRLPAAGTRA